MCVGYFLVLLDVTIVNVALPRLGADLGAGVSGLQWVVDGYAIALASLMLAGGTVGDIHGHRRVVLTGLAIFGLASLGCGLAPDTASLVAGRVAQGVGAALLLPGTLAIVTNAFRKPGEQARAIGIWAAVGSVALPAGPLLGGALVDGVGWRAVFLVNVPVAVVALLVAARVVADERAAPSRRVDRLGTVLGALALAALTFAFIEAGRDGAGGPVVAGLAAVALAAALVAVERRSPDPLFPPGLFRHRAFSAANAVAGAMNLGTLGVLFLLTLYLQRVQGRSPLEAGVATIPLFAPLSLIAPLAGRLTARAGARAPMIAGLACSALGLALLVRLDAGSHYLTLLPALALWGIGLGLLTPAVVAAAMGAAPVERGGLAAAINNTARQAGGAVGIAAFGALAGVASDERRFLSGLHTAALVAAGVYVAAIVATALLVPGEAARRA